MKECVEKVKRVWKRNGKVSRAMTLGVLLCRRITDVEKNASLVNEYHKRGGNRRPSLAHRFVSSSDILLKSVQPADRIYKPNL